MHIGWSVLRKRVFQESKNDPKMMPKVTKNVGTGGDTRIGKQAFRMESIAKTKVSSRKKASKFVEIGIDFFKKRSRSQKIIKKARDVTLSRWSLLASHLFYRFWTENCPKLDLV